MVSYSLRPNVVAAWNSYCHQEAVITGLEPEEILVENCLFLSDHSVQAILNDADCPRTRELYSPDLVLFLVKGILQSPPMSTDNSEKLLYARLMKSLSDIIHFHDLLSGETSKFTTNKAKMPPTGYETKGSPGDIALWLISFGSQKDSVMQWLGKDKQFPWTYAGTSNAQPCRIVSNRSSTTILQYPLRPLRCPFRCRNRRRQSRLHAYRIAWNSKLLRRFSSRVSTSNPWGCSWWRSG